MREATQYGRRPVLSFIFHFIFFTFFFFFFILGFVLEAQRRSGRDGPLSRLEGHARLQTEHSSRMRTWTEKMQGGQQEARRTAGALGTRTKRTTRACCSTSSKCLRNSLRQRASVAISTFSLKALALRPCLALKRCPSCCQQHPQLQPLADCVGSRDGQLHTHTAGVPHRK